MAKSPMPGMSGLTPSQKKVVTKDFGMNAGKRVISVRHAMLFYVLKKLNLLNDPENEDPRQQHIIVVNKGEVRQALKLTDTVQARRREPGRTAKPG
jgi:hypothetical protein